MLFIRRDVLFRGSLDSTLACSSWWSLWLLRVVPWSILGSLCFVPCSSLIQFWSFRVNLKSIILRARVCVPGYRASTQRARISFRSQIFLFKSNHVSSHFLLNRRKLFPILLVLWCPQIYHAAPFEFQSFRFFNFLILRLNCSEGPLMNWRSVLSLIARTSSLNASRCMSSLSRSRLSRVLLLILVYHLINNISKVSIGHPSHLVFEKAQFIFLNEVFGAKFRPMNVLPRLLQTVNPIANSIISTTLLLIYCHIRFVLAIIGSIRAHCLRWLILALGLGKQTSNLLYFLVFLLDDLLKLFNHFFLRQIFLL